MHPALEPIASVVGPLTFDATALLSEFKRRQLAREELWLREGQVCRRLAFVESGLLRHVRSTEGEELTRWATLPGQYALNFPSFTTGAPSEDHIVATMPTVVYELDRDRWQDWRQREPQLQAFWVATLEYLLVCFEDRVFSLISGDASSRYAYMMNRYPDFLLHLPQHFVADLLGIAPRHLSRIRAAHAQQQPSEKTGSS